MFYVIKYYVCVIVWSVSGTKQDILRCLLRLLVSCTSN